MKKHHLYVAIFHILDITNCASNEHPTTSSFANVRVHLNEELLCHREWNLHFYLIAKLLSRLLLSI